MRFTLRCADMRSTPQAGPAAPSKTGVGHLLARPWGRAGRPTTTGDHPARRFSLTPKGAPGRWALTAVRRARPFLRVAASRAIVGRARSRTDPAAGRFTHHDVVGFVDEAFTAFEREAPSLPAEPTAGSRQNVLLAALTLAMLQALEHAGVERGYAIELTGDTCWRFYRHWDQVTKAVTGLTSRNPTQRLQRSVNAFLAYPFGPPGYRFTNVPQPDGRSLDMVRCPVADYLGPRGAADLGAGSWCNLDYALAEMWDARLQRSGTLLAGAPCCDFRFHINTAAGTGK